MSTKRNNEMMNTEAAAHTRRARAALFFALVMLSRPDIGTKSEVTDCPPQKIMEKAFHKRSAPNLAEIKAATIIY